MATDSDVHPLRRMAKSIGRAGSLTAFLRAARTDAFKASLTGESIDGSFDGVGFEGVASSEKTERRCDASPPTEEPREMRRPI